MERLNYIAFVNLLTGINYRIIMYENLYGDFICNHEDKMKKQENYAKILSI